jgi:hypothetical protein
MTSRSVQIWVSPAPSAHHISQSSVPEPTKGGQGPARVSHPEVLSTVGSPNRGTYIRLTVNNENRRIPDIEASTKSVMSNERVMMHTHIE